MLHGLVPHSLLPDATGAFLGPGWSVSTEWQFYLVAPLAVALCRSAAGWRVLGCLSVLVCFVGFNYLGFASSLRNDTASMLGFKAHYFFIGGVLYWLWTEMGDWFNGLPLSGRARRICRDCGSPGPDDSG